MERAEGDTLVGEGHLVETQRADTGLNFRPSPPPSSPSRPTPDVMQGDDRDEPSSPLTSRCASSTPPTPLSPAVHDHLEVRDPNEEGSEMPSFHRHDHAVDSMSSSSSSSNPSSSSSSSSTSTLPLLPTTMTCSGPSSSSSSSLSLLAFPDEVLMYVLSHVDGREVEQSLGRVCKRLLRLTRDDWLWFIMTKRLVKREREERSRKQALERRDVQLKRRHSNNGNEQERKHLRTSDEVQEGERMELEEKPTLTLSCGPASLLALAHAAGQHKNDGDNNDPVLMEQACDEDEDQDSSELEGSNYGPCRQNPLQTNKQGRVKKAKFDLLKPGNRDWKWVYKCKTTILLQPHSEKITGIGRYTWNCGSYYEGEWKDGKPDGIGTRIWDDDEYYQGEWKNGKMDGHGRYQWPDGAYYDGQWKDGLHEGFGIYFWADGNKYEGNWKAGQRDGYGVRIWTDGDIFEGEWVAGKRTGKGVYSWPNGSRYEGEWKNGCHHGYGIYTWLDGRSYEGQWEANKKHGMGTYRFDTEGCSYTGSWEDGFRQGLGEMTWDDGTKYVGLWVRDARVHGKCFAPDGRLIEDPVLAMAPRPYDQYFMEEESAWEAKYRNHINQKRMEALARLKAQGKLPFPIREDKVLDPES